MATQIEHGHCGFLVANVEEAATSIGALLRDRTLRRNMGRRAHQRVAPAFPYDSVARGLARFNRRPDAASGEIVCGGTEERCIALE